MSIKLSEDDFDLIVKTLSWRHRKLNKHIKEKEERGFDASEAIATRAKVSELWYRLNQERKKRR